MGRAQEPMGRRKYWPIYEACAETGVHVASHAFGAYGHPITGAGHASFYIEDHTSPPQAMQANITSLVVEGVFDRFPGLKLVSVENGFGWMPSLLWRLDASWTMLRAEVPHLERRAVRDRARARLALDPADRGAASTRAASSSCSITTAICATT